MRRSQISQALDTIPDKALLGAASKELTPKQRKFAREVAKGASKAEAYRRSYNQNPAPSTIACSPYKLASDARVQQEIEAYKVALEAQEYRTPAALRALVIQSLTQTLLDGDTPPAVRVQAARVLGTVTEVGAFTERREITRIDGSAAAREKLLAELRDMMRTVEMPAAADAESLLSELAGPHGGGDTPDADVTHHGATHTIPHTSAPTGIVTTNDPHPSDMGDPPVEEGSDGR